jgi:hypothetical protein
VDLLSRWAQEAFSWPGEGPCERQRQKRSENTLKRQEGLVPRLPPAAPTKNLYNKTFELDQVFASLEAARAIDSQPLIMDNRADGTDSHFT